MKQDERNKKQFKTKEYKFTNKKFAHPKKSNKEKMDYQYEYYVEGMEEFDKWGRFEY